MSRGTFAEIDLRALQHNLQQVRHFAPRQQVYAMVKADAYGHGLIDVAKALSAVGVDGFGVAFLDEGLALRRAGLRERIISLEGFYNLEELKPASEYQIDLVVHHAAQVEQLAQLPASQPVRVWLKIDTGMHRLGFLPEHALATWQRLSDITAIQELNLLTHFACPDDLNNPFTTQQFNSFNEVTQSLPGLRSLANSAAILAWPQTHGDAVRPGIMLYGISPFTGKTGLDHDLQAVMTLHSELIAIHHLKQGAQIGYGGTYTCPTDMPVGVIAIGYGDGYPRHAPNGTPVLVNNQRVPLVGRVSMDMITVDLRAQPQAQIGDPAILWGKGLPVEEIATLCSTIGYELVTQVTARVPKKFYTVR